MNTDRSLVRQLAGRFPALALGIASLFYVYFCVQVFRATRLAASRTETGLQRATKLAPGDSDYWRELGVVQLYQENRPDSALASFHRAIEVNPQDADAWIQTAYALQLLGRADEERNAIVQAIALAPARPEIRWRAANLFAQFGEQQASRENLRFVLAYDPGRADAALKLASRTKGDWQTTVELFPRNPEIYGRFALQLAKSNDCDAALNVWQAMIHRIGAVDEASGLDLLNDFLAQKRFDLAQQVWISLLQHHSELSAYAPLAPNLISNAIFSSPLFDRGLSWRRLDAQQLDIRRETIAQGQALRLSWEAQTVTRVLEQIVPVQPNQWYRFSFTSRSSEFLGANGPFVSISDLESGRTLFRSSDLRGFPEWKSQNAQVQATGKFVVVGITRDAPTPLRGTLWLSDFVLEPAIAAGKAMIDSAEVH